jgi:hypothetical protein
MKSFSILANVMVNKNTRQLIGKSPRKRRVNIYFINALTGEKYMLAVHGDESSKEKFEIDMKMFYSLHGKFVHEGKATLVFRDSMNQDIAPQSKIISLNIEPVFDEYTIFLSDCLSSNLIDFLQNTIKVVEYIKQLPKKEEQIPLGINIKKEEMPRSTIRDVGKSLSKIEMTDNNSKNLNLQGVARVNRFRNQEILDQLEEEEAEAVKLRKKRPTDANLQNNIKQSAKLSSNNGIALSKNVSKKESKEKFLVRYFGYIWLYLERGEISLISQICKKIKGTSDLLTSQLTIRTKNPSPDIYKALLKRFRSIECLNFSKGVNMKFTRDFFAELSLKRLKSLDISKCLNINDKIINMFLISAPNLTSIKLPYNATQPANFNFLAQYGSPRLSTFKLKYNLSIKTESSLNSGGRVIESFLESFRELKVFQIYSLTPQCMANISFCDMSLYRLKRLKISLIGVTDATKDAPLLFLSKLHSLESLKITSIILNRQIFQPDDEWKRSYLRALSRMTHLRKLTLGDFYDNGLSSLVSAMLSSIGVKLTKVKIKSRVMDDECLSDFLKFQKNIETLDISQCRSIEGSCFRSFKENGRCLRQIVVSFDDHRMNLLKSAIRDSELSKCRIVKII